MKRIFSLAIAATIAVIGLKAPLKAQSETTDPAIVWGWDFEQDYTTGEYIWYRSQPRAAFLCANYYNLRYNVGLEGAEINVNAWITADLIYDGASIYAHPDTIKVLPVGHEGIDYRTFYPFMGKVFAQDGYEPVPGKYELTFSLLKITKSPNGTITSCQAWNDSEGEQISLEFEFTLLDEPEIGFAYPFTAHNDITTLVYASDSLPRFRIDFPEADKMGTGYLLTVKVQHMTTENKKFYVDTIRTTEGLNYTFPANWKTLYNENPNDKDDIVPEFNEYTGERVIDHHSITFNIYAVTGDELIDISPKESDFGRPMLLYFFDENLPAKPVWKDIRITDPEAVYIYEDMYDMTGTFVGYQWLVKAYEGDRVPEVENGVLGVGAGAYHIVLDVTDPSGHLIQQDTLRHAPHEIGFDAATISPGQYTSTLTLLRYDDTGRLNPVTDENGHPVQASYELTLLNHSGVADEKLGVSEIKLYPNPSDGRFNLELPEKALLEVFSLNGSLVAREEAASGLKHLYLDKSGVYLLRICYGKQTHVRRLIVR